MMNMKQNNLRFFVSYNLIHFLCDLPKAMAHKMRGVRNARG